jgi:hypothetical protein
MRTYLKSLTIVLIVILTSTSYLGAQHVSAQIDKTSLKLQQGNILVSQAFKAVLDAENSRVNVTNLLIQLNLAESTLAQAENLFRTGDSNTASTQAESAIQITQKVILSANDAKESALVSSQNAFWSTLVLSIISASVFVLLLLLFWSLIKRDYCNRLSKEKPEIKANEAN